MSISYHGHCLVDHFQHVSLSGPHSSSTQQRAESAHVASLPADDFADVPFRYLKLNHVIIEMIDEHLIGSVHHPLGNLFDENANVCAGFGGHSGCHATEAAAAGAGLEYSFPTRSDICAPFETQ